MKYFKMLDPADTGILQVVKLDSGELVKSYVPEIDDNAQWTDYQAWLAEGNTPIPPPPGPGYDIDYDNDTWVVNPALVNEPQKQVLVGQFIGTDRVLLKLIVKIFQTLQSKGLITKADIGDALVDEAQALRQALQDYENL